MVGRWSLYRIKNWPKRSNLENDIHANKKQAANYTVVKTPHATVNILTQGSSQTSSSHRVCCKDWSCHHLLWWDTHPQSVILSFHSCRGPWFELENLWLQCWRGAHPLSGWSNLKKFGFTGRNHLNGMKSWKYLGTRWPSLIWVLRNPMTESYVPGFWLWRMVIVLPLLVIFASYAVSISDLLKEAFTRGLVLSICCNSLLTNDQK